MEKQNAACAHNGIYSLPLRAQWVNPKGLRLGEKEPTYKKPPEQRFLRQNGGGQRLDETEWGVGISWGQSYSLGR